MYDNVFEFTGTDGPKFSFESASAAFFVALTLFFFDSRLRIFLLLTLVNVTILEPLKNRKLEAAPKY